MTTCSTIFQPKYSEASTQPGCLAQRGPPLLNPAASRNEARANPQPQPTRNRTNPQPRPTRRTQLQVSTYPLQLWPTTTTCGTIFQPKYSEASTQPSCLAQRGFMTFDASYRRISLADA